MAKPTGDGVNPNRLKFPTDFTKVAFQGQA